MGKLTKLLDEMLRDNWINEVTDPEMMQLRKDLLPYLRRAYFLGRTDERAIRRTRKAKR